jgi:DNA-directed RNA polymerase subunit RPC12/RpoP
MEVKLTIACKKTDNKAFKGKEDENWYNINNDVIPVLEKLSKNDEIMVTYEQKGVVRQVSKIVTANVVQAPITNPGSGYKCSVCGKELKDGNYKKCFECNKSGAVKPTTPAPETGFKCETCGAPLKNDKYKKCFKCGKKGKSFGGNSFYGSPEDIAGKEMGCVLGAAGAAASGRPFINEQGKEDPEQAAQWIRIVAENLLDWMKGKK